MIIIEGHGASMCKASFAVYEIMRSLSTEECGLVYKTNQSSIEGRGLSEKESMRSDDKEDMRDKLKIRCSQKEMKWSEWGMEFLPIALQIVHLKMMSEGPI